jgi:hypothetical protein
MEAREFFANGPMHEITVSATPEEWRDIINDVIALDPPECTQATRDLFDKLDALGLV